MLSEYFCFLHIIKYLYYLLKITKRVCKELFRHLDHVNTSLYIQKSSKKKMLPMDYAVILNKNEVLDFLMNKVFESLSKYSNEGSFNNAWRSGRISMIFYYFLLTVFLIIIIF